MQITDFLLVKMQVELQKLEPKVRVIAAINFWKEIRKKRCDRKEWTYLPGTSERSYEDSPRILFASERYNFLIEVYVPRKVNPLDLSVGD